MTIVSRIMSVVKTDPHITEIKGKNHRLSYSNRLYEASFHLSPADHDEFVARSVAIEDDLRQKLDIVGAAYDEGLEKIKATARVGANEARAAYDTAKWKLFEAFFKLPTREEVAASETPVGEVVRAPQIADEPKAVVA